MSSLKKLGSLAKTRTEKTCVHILSKQREEHPHDLWLRIKSYEAIMKRHKNRVGRSMSKGFYKEMEAFLEVTITIYRKLGGKYE